MRVGRTAMHMRWPAKFSKESNQADRLRYRSTSYIGRSRGYSDSQQEAPDGRPKTFASRTIPSGKGGSSSINERQDYARNQRYRLGDDGGLYDINRDPGQRNDISQQKPDVAERLQTAIDRFKKNVKKDYGVDDRPFIIAHPDYRYTQIPARDGIAHGAIQRSNRWPNCSFFRNWVNVDDIITWGAEVGASGKYRVEIEYACPEEDVGSTIQLSFNDSKLKGKITESHDPPLRGGENDRHPRGESYVKDFKTMELGVIELEKGEGTLTLTPWRNREIK